MKLPEHVLERFRNDPELLPLRPLHGWRSSPDEGDHTHCTACGDIIFVGDPCVGTYLKYISVVFCPRCVADNQAQFRDWIDPRLADR